MKPARETTLAVLILLAVLAVNTIALWPELALGRVDLNRSVLHFSLIERVVQAVERGENPLDCWSSEASFGYPLLRTVPPLSHWLVAAVYFLLGKTVALMTVFVWMRFLVVVLLPLSFFGFVRRIGLPPLTAAAAALLAPLISTNLLSGVEYGSFTWAGGGLFPQAVATHLLLAAIGAAWPAIRYGRRIVPAGVLVGLTALAHLVYGYVALVSVFLLAVLPDAESSRTARFLGAAWVAVAAALLAAFQVAPLILDHATLNHSSLEPEWTWGSFGAGTVLQWALTGKLLDYGRLPVLTLLAAAGAAVCIWKLCRRESAAAHRFTAAGALFWLLFYFGRPFWGTLLTLLGATRDMPLHSVIGGLHVFLVILAAIGLAALWGALAGNRRAGIAVLATLLLLFPAARERVRTLLHGVRAGRSQHDGMASLIEAARARGGRTYTAEAPVFAALIQAQLPVLGHPYHTPALTDDLLPAFDSAKPEHLRLFNIRTVVAAAPASSSPDPGGGYFDVVDVVAAVTTTRNTFQEVNTRWLRSDWVGRRVHLWLDWNNDAPPERLRVYPYNDLPTVPVLFPPPGTVVREGRSGETYTADLTAARPSYALFKMTWHRNWKAYLDGAPRPAAMLSPGFIGVATPPGRHRIEMRYQPGPLKTTLALGGLIGIFALGLTLRPTAPDRAKPRVPYFWRSAAGVMLLALPVCLPLFTTSLIVGHDGYYYFTRVTEVDQNVANGILLPRWAPDLGSGAGQPLFLLHPPLFYWIAEAWRLPGLEFVTAVNLACVLIVVASAAGMFLFGRLYFGEPGGWLAAAAYIYAPYFATDLYVRSALEEFTAFALFPFALFGFGVYARCRDRRYLALGAAAFAGVIMTHLPCTLLFTPLLMAFLTLTAWMERSWRVLLAQAAGWLLGLALAACIWLPALLERQYIQLSRATTGSLSYAIHFVYWRQLLFSPWGYGFSVEGPGDGMPFAVGWSLLTVAAAAWVWTERQPDAHRRIAMVRLLGTAALLFCLLMLRSAAPVWKAIPALQFVLFPWRMLGQVSLCCAILAGGLGAGLRPLQGWRRCVFLAAMAILIVPNLAHQRPGVTQDIDPTFWTPKELAAAAFDTAVAGELTPLWVKTTTPYNPRAANVVSGDLHIEQLARTPFSWEGRVSANGPGVVGMSLAYFPGWTVAIDGRTATFGPGDPSGMIEFAVAPGEHVVDVRWGTSAPRKTGERISMVSLVVLGVVVYRRRAFFTSHAPR